jgi:anti-anti-sigma factor
LRPDLDDQALENRLRVRTDYLGSCVVIGVAGEIDIATADRLRMQVIIAVLGVTAPSVVIDLGEVEFCYSTGLARWWRSGKRSARTAGNSSWPAHKTGAAPCWPCGCRVSGHLVRPGCIRGGGR